MKILEKSKQLFLIFFLFLCCTNVFAKVLSLPNSCNDIDTCLPLAKKGNVYAQKQLANILYFNKKSNFLNDNYSKAFYWYKKAAQKGDAWSEYQIGCMYRDGQGIIQDYNKAFYWLKKAAKKGLFPAQYDLGIFLHNVKKDNINAYAFLNIACAQSSKIDTKPRDLIFSLLTPEEKNTAQKFSKAYWQKYVLPYIAKPR